MGTSEPSPPQPLRWWSQVWRYSLAVTISAVLWGVAVIAANAPGSGFSQAALAWLLVFDPLLGLVAFIVVGFRRRWPMPVALIVTALSGVSAVAAGPWALALCSLATRRRVRELAVVVPLSLLASLGYEFLYQQDEPLPIWAALLIAGLITAVLVAVGSSVGSDRARMQSLRDRAETSEREQQARVAAARAEERTRIAREMHDVLAHRISLVSMHAGALTYRDDLPREQQIAVARTIEDNAQLAMHDLRDVLGVLRAPDGGDGIPQPPQPGIDDLGALVAEAMAAGTRVEMDNRLAGPVSATTGRTVYRIVQESLTNARKHAPACPVTVTVEGGPGEGVEVVVSNPLPVGAATAPSSAGVGLLGLGERVDLLGGSLAHGPAGGRFVVRASLPWSA